MELDLCHPSAAQNFELAQRVFENIRTAALMYYVEPKKIIAQSGLGLE
jgi:hypothetical protein